MPLITILVPGVLKLITLNLLVFRGFSVTDLLEADNGGGDMSFEEKLRFNFPAILYQLWNVVVKSLIISVIYLGLCIVYGVRGKSSLNPYIRVKH